MLVGSLGGVVRVPIQRFNGGRERAAGGRTGPAAASPVDQGHFRNWRVVLELETGVEHIGGELAIGRHLGRAAVDGTCGKISGPGLVAVGVRRQYRAEGRVFDKARIRAFASHQVVDDAACL